MKKILALLLVLCLTVTLFAACGKEIDNGNDPVNTGDQPVIDNSDPVDNPDNSEDNATAPAPAATWNGYDIDFVKDNGLDYIWNQLGDEMRADFATVMNTVKNEELTCKIPYGIPDDEATAFLEFIYNSSIDYPYLGTQFYFQDTDNDGLRDTVLIAYNFEVAPMAEDAFALVAELNAKLDEIVAAMPAGTEYEQIRYLHDYLVFNCSYGEDGRIPFTAYGALVEKSATCQGYADAMHLLLARAGFETVYTIGRGDRADVTHKWNYVKLSNGQWYIIDPTWADPTGRDDPYYVNYDYFLISDEEILLDHLAKFDCIYYTNPVATSMDMSFHSVEGYYVTSYEEAYAAAEKQVLECAQEGRRYVYLRVSDEATYDEIRRRMLLTGDSGDGEMENIFASVKSQTGVEYTTWTVYRAHKDGAGPLAFTITIKKDGE